MHHFPVQVRQSVDVWSAGCVFSEVAVWSRFGWNRLREYRCKRQEEIKQLRDLDGEHWFHDEHNVLQTVRDIHEHMTRKPRTVDEIIVKVIRILTDKMLLSEHQRKASARDVYTEFMRAIDTERNTLTIAKSRSVSGNGQDMREDVREDMGDDSGSNLLTCTQTRITAVLQFYGQGH